MFKIGKKKFFLLSVYFLVFIISVSLLNYKIKIYEEQQPLRQIFKELEQQCPMNCSQQGYPAFNGNVGIIKEIQTYSIFNASLNLNRLEKETNTVWVGCGCIGPLGRTIPIKIKQINKSLFD